MPTVYVAPWLFRFKDGLIVMVFEETETCASGTGIRVEAVMAGVLRFRYPAEPSWRSVSNEMTMLLSGETAEAPCAGEYAWIIGPAP